MVEDDVLGHILGIHGLDGVILAVLDEQRNLLVVGGEGVVGERPQEQGLSLDPVDARTGQAGLLDAGEDEVAAVHHVVVVTPGPLVADIDLAGGVEVVVREVPLLGGVPHLVAADGVQGVAHAGEGALQADAVVAGHERLFEVGLGVTEVIGGLVVRVLDVQILVAGSCGTEDDKGCQDDGYLFHMLVHYQVGHHLRRRVSHPASR